MNMIINSETKIAAILKHQPESLEAIISISPKFEKLRNPILRKLMAGRASVSMASKMGGCSVSDFFTKLRPLGFETNSNNLAIPEDKKQFPVFFASIDPGKIIELDVRPIIETGNDPLRLIIKKIKRVQEGQVLKIINSFEPIPLILLLEEQGFESYSDIIDDNLVETYFYRVEPFNPETVQLSNIKSGWDAILQRFQDKTQIIDVRALEMPLPMLTILDALDKLPAETALFVYHKRVPVFLLPELAQRKFDYRINEISDSEVHLLIFRA